VRIPQTIVAGDSTSWLDDASSDNLGTPILPGDWSLTYALRGPSSLTLTASVVNGQWKTSITAVQSAALDPGVYYWQAFASKSPDRVTLGSGQITVTKNVFAESDPFDGRSQARIDLDAVQAAMRAIIAGGAVQEYTIGSRSLRKMAMSDLIMLESRLKAEVVREKKAEMIRNGLGNPSNLFVRFK
jgi:nitrogen fixation protein FixH